MCKNILIIDRVVSFGNPATKSLLDALPELKRRGLRFSVWGSEVDDDVKEFFEKIELIQLPQLRYLSPFADVWFWVGCQWKGLRTLFTSNRESYDYILCNSWYYLGANGAVFHFFNPPWMAAQIKIGGWNKNDLIHFVMCAITVPFQLLQLYNPRCRDILPVSEGLRGSLMRWGASKKSYRVFPNSYDDSIFSPATRERARMQARDELKFHDDDIIFCFASQGHYRRKGFWNAVSALEQVRAEIGANVKMLVIGGHEETLKRLKKTLASRLGESFIDWITFTGMVDNTHFYLSAADGFLFPSYFEAFSLVEIEAAALGIPLFLTPHFGVEMILREGENGHQIGYSPDEIARTIIGAIRGGLPDQNSTGRAVNHDGYINQIVDVFSRENG